MAKQQYSSHQQKIIANYYDNLDTIMLTKLQELVTELYLADSKQKQDRLWERAHKAMVKMKIKPALIDHIMKQRLVTTLAKNVEDWLRASNK
ncbi:MAG: hypothetical protein KAR47_21915 [Planctomycetes bacterium]|nr:hypothetical protein [Planctomycetota bacterium]